MDTVQRCGSQPDLLQPVDGRRCDVVRPGSRSAAPMRTSARSAAERATTIRAPIRSSARTARSTSRSANGNVPGNGIEQVLIVTCPACADCSNQASWTGPTKVGDMISTQPVGPPSQNGCPNRQCLPPNGYRAPDETTVTELGRPERKRVRRRGRITATTRTRTASWARPAADPRRATTTSSTRSPRTEGRRGATRGTSRHVRASARPHSGSRGAT